MAHPRKKAKITHTTTTTPTTQTQEVDFLVNLDQKSGTEIRIFALSLYEAAKLDGLKRLLAAVNDELKKRARRDRQEWDKSKLYIESNIRLLENSRAEAEPSGATKRVAGVTVGLDEVLKHHIDLAGFKIRVDELFKWYSVRNKNQGMKTYMAPYFPVVQSSGTGKTRLFVALRDSSYDTDTNIDYECISLLCSKHDAHEADNSDLFYDKILRLPQPVDDEGNAKKRVVTLITNFLNGIVAKTTKDKVVLLFDEAQLLLDLDGVAFRCIRWWLRKERSKKVVAAFAGTTSNLVNFYRDPPPSEFSRDAKATYFNWTRTRGGPNKLYAPFFRICTMGCYHNDFPSDDRSLSDFQSAAYFGRPLFACLQKKNQLVTIGDTKETGNNVVVTNSTLYAIISRMLLSEAKSCWKVNKTALCSVLGSRVQMGITTSFLVSSDLVSHAYAHLSHFHPDEGGDMSKAVARITFMPDPVCAALAMGLMHENWTLTDGVGKVTGEDPTFWSKEAMELLKTGLCLPEKGNAGEIMAALYMLFCGDLLRHRIDTTLRSFSVPLMDWYSIMRGHKMTKRACHLNPKQRGSVSMDVNFIQVCRNYFRAHSWKTQKALRLMYNSATAIYVYPDCKAIDLVAAVRVIRNGKTSYHPLLVSVKCWTQMPYGKMNEAIDKIKNLLAEIRHEATDEGNTETDGEDTETEDEETDTEHEETEDEDEKSNFEETNAEETDSEETESEETENEEARSDAPKCPNVLGLLVLIGAQTQLRQPSAQGEYGFEHLSSFPEEDTFRIISVPENDSFNISNAVREMTTVHANTEIFSSHGFVYGEDIENPGEVLRGRHKKGLLKSVNDLFLGLSKK